MLETTALQKTDFCIETIKGQAGVAGRNGEIAYKAMAGIRVALDLVDENINRACQAQSQGIFLIRTTVNKHFSKPLQGGHKCGLSLGC